MMIVIAINARIGPDMMIIMIFRVPKECIVA